jgi:predicted ribosomally synthesized peptide with nif11-like leader
LSVSVEDLRKYGKLCEEDEEARRKVRKIGVRDLEGHIAHAKSLGLEIAKEDFEALAKEAGLGKNDELNDEELEKVAGGAIGAALAAAGVFLGAAVAALGNKPGW